MRAMTWIPTLALVLLAAPTVAQGVGSKVPAVELEDFTQTPAKTFEDFQGRAVLIEFFAFWWGPCKGQVGHLNELQEKWGGKGLSILAVTDEGASETEKFVEETSMRYAYAYDKGGKLARYFGVRGIPHSVLIDASGTVAWAGHPGSLDERMIQSATAGALPKPLWEWTGGAKAVKTALLKRDFKAALAQAEKLGEGDNGPEILAAVQGMVKARVETLKAAQAKGDYLAAQTTAAALAKELAGLPEAAEASAVAAAIKADPKALEVIKGQQKLAKIRGRDLAKRKDRIEAITDLRKLRGEHLGTYVEVEADALIAQINAMQSDD